MKNNFKQFDYFAQIKQIIHQLEENNIACFIPELNDLLKAFQAKKEFYNAYMYLESLRSRLFS